MTFGENISKSDLYGQSMKNPEKSVEEVVEEFIKNNGIVLLKEFTKGDVIGLQSIRPQLENLLQAERQKREEVVEAERERSTKLWDILDHIDTIPDMMHPNTPEAHEKCWRYMVEATHKRHDILKTDGYNLTHPNNK